MLYFSHNFTCTAAKPVTTAPAPSSRRIHLLKGAGALEQMRKHASDVYRAVVKYLLYSAVGCSAEGSRDAIIPSL